MPTSKPTPAADQSAAPAEAAVVFEDEAEPERITTGQAAQLLGTSSTTLRAWTRARMVKVYAVTPSGRYVYLRKDVIAFRDQMRHDAEIKLRAANAGAKR